MRGVAVARSRRGSEDFAKVVGAGGYVLATANANLMRW